MSTTTLITDLPAAASTALSLRDWRSKRTRAYTTADGLTFQLRICSVLDLMEEGVIPQALLGKIQTLTNKPADEVAAAMANDLDDFVRMVNAVVCALVRSPRVLSRRGATDLIDAVHRTYGDAATRDDVVAWLDAALAGVEVPELAGTARAALVARYCESVLVEEIDWEDRQAIFTLAMAGVGPAATFPR